MVAVVLHALVLAGTGLLMRTVATRIASGQMDPNMGHHTRSSTTPDSWEAMTEASVRVLSRSGSYFVGAGAVGLVLMALTGSIGTAMLVATALVVVATLVLIVGVMRASSLLQSNGSITR